METIKLIEYKIKAQVPEKARYYCATPAKKFKSRITPIKAERNAFSPPMQRLSEMRNTLSPVTRMAEVNSPTTEYTMKRTVRSNMTS